MTNEYQAHSPAQWPTKGLGRDLWLLGALLVTAGLYVALFFIQPKGENWGHGWNLVAFFFYSVPAALVAGGLAAWRTGKLAGRGHTVAVAVAAAGFLFPIVCLLAIRAKA